MKTKDIPKLPPLPVPSAWRTGDFAVVDVGSVGTQLALVVEHTAGARPKIRKWSSKKKIWLPASHILSGRLIGRPRPDDKRLVAAIAALASERLEAVEHLTEYRPAAEDNA